MASTSSFGGEDATRSDGDPLVSVVVPAYNVDEYIRPCLESLKGQTFRGMEIVVVDDGSTDETGEALSRFAQRPGLRVRVLTQENRGLSAARNAGLAVASGELVTFVDGDDVVAPEYVEALVAAMVAAGADLSVCGFTTCVPGESPVWPDPPSRAQRLNQPEALEEMMYGRAIGPSACGKLARKSLWETHSFPVGLLYEDLATIPGVVGDCSVVAVVPEGLYGVTLREGSITRSRAPSAKNVEDLEKAIEMCSSSIEARPSGRLEAALRARRAQEFCRLVHLAQSVDQSDQSVRDSLERAMSEIRSNARMVLLDRRALLSTKLRLLLTLGPPGVYRRVWGLKKRAEGWLSN